MRMYATSDELKRILSLELELENVRDELSPPVNAEIEMLFIGQKHAVGVLLASYCWMAYRRGCSDQANRHLKSNRIMLAIIVFDLAAILLTLLKLK